MLAIFRDLVVTLQVWSMTSVRLRAQTGGLLQPPYQIVIVSRVDNMLRFECRETETQNKLDSWVLYRNCVPENTTDPCISVGNYSDGLLTISSQCDGLYSCGVEYTSISSTSGTTGLVLTEPMSVYATPIPIETAMQSVSACVGETVFLPSFMPVSPLGNNEVIWFRLQNSGVVSAENGIVTADYSYNLVNVSTLDAGIYFAKVTAPGSTPVNGPSVTLTVTEKPGIDLIKVVDGLITVTVTPHDAEFKYEWRLNGIVSQKNGQTFSLPSTIDEDDQIELMISSPCGASVIATIYILTIPTASLASTQATIASTEATTGSTEATIASTATTTASTQATAVSIQTTTGTVEVNFVETNFIVILVATVCATAIIMAIIALISFLVCCIIKTPNKTAKTKKPPSKDEDDQIPIISMELSIHPDDPDAENQLDLPTERDTFPYAESTFINPAPFSPEPSSHQGLPTNAMSGEDSSIRTDTSAATSLDIPPTGGLLNKITSDTYKDVSALKLTQGEGIDIIEHTAGEAQSKEIPSISTGSKMKETNSSQTSRFNIIPLHLSHLSKSVPDISEVALPSMHDILMNKAHSHYNLAYSFDEVEEFELNPTGTFVHSVNHGVSIVVPEGAVSSPTKLWFTAALYGPFVYPSGQVPVSAIVWLQSETPLLKPAQLRMPHWIAISDEQECQKLTFLTADDIPKDDLLSHILLRPDTRQGVFTPGSIYASIEMDHFCFECIACIDQSLLDYCRFCVTEVVQDTLIDNQWRVDYCVTYALPTCLKTLKNQYDHEVRIEEKAIVNLGCDGVELQFVPEPQQGWTMTRTSLYKKVMKSMVDFRLFGKTETGEVNLALMKLQLQFAESQRAYPPRLSLLIHCDMVTAFRNLSATLTLLGTDPQIESCIFITLPNPPPGLLRPAGGNTIVPKTGTSKQVKKDVDLGLLIVELQDNLANKWLVFGLTLGLEIEQLECIETNHPNNCQKCTTKLLISWWKQQESPNWEQIIEALRKIGDERLALTITEKYLTKDLTVA